jgi:hypothetical protein
MIVLFTTSCPNHLLRQQVQRLNQPTDAIHSELTFITPGVVRSTPKSLEKHTILWVLGGFGRYKAKLVAPPARRLAKGVPKGAKGERGSTVLLHNLKVYSKDLTGGETALPRSLQAGLSHDGPSAVKRQMGLAGARPSRK